MADEEHLSVKPPSVRQPDARASTPWQIAWATLSKPAGALSGLLIIGLVLSELLSPTVRRVTSGYPLTTSFIGTFITLAFTATIINQIVTKRLQTRWERVRSIAMQGLNDELRLVRDILYTIEHGAPPFDAPLPVVAAIKAKVPLAIGEQMAISLAAEPNATLVAALVEQAIWVQFARTSLAEASAYLRGSLARWSSLLSMGAEVSDASHTMILNSAYIADAVSVVELPFAAARLVCDVLPADVRPIFVELWEVLAAAFVFVEERSANALRPSIEHFPGRTWKSAMRIKLSQESATFLARWDSSRDGDEVFHEDLIRTRNALECIQVDYLDLTSSQLPTRNAQLAE